MAGTFDAALLKARLGFSSPHRNVKSLYGHTSWAEDLDIVNELGGHSGCVNALSWSTSGRLLASGSDDTQLNIWAYNPDGTAKPFTLKDSISTGHHANIFSVKFMPHSDDRRVVSCAGDSEVRVFDLEYSERMQNGAGNAFTASTRSRRFSDFFPNARWLSDANTNVRIYRSHADRAKRIVTESSPHLFLTCSEDGEVRQWDLRQPSSAYPAPRDGRGFGRFNRSRSEVSDNVPPPLISYKKYGLDLNSISCASSQPHYIALGGAHLHCFLHDRRYLGRDLHDEAGVPANRKPTVGMYEDDAMSSATRCVRRFAPNDQRRMGSHSPGHITACKISDARPDEMVVSWSGDHVYSFDLVKSPDARDAEAEKDEAFQKNRLRHRQDRKRKRKPIPSSSSLNENGNPPSRLRRVSNQQEEDGTSALRVRYDDGETEELPITTARESTESSVPETLLNETQRLADSIAHGLIRLRKEIFDFSASLGEDGAAALENTNELSPHTRHFSTALGSAVALLPQMEDIISHWRYPVDPSEDEVIMQNSFRRHRQSAWRFVHAAGTLSRVLGGRLQTLSSAPDPRMDLYRDIRPAVHEGRNLTPQTQFCYDFLKAILLWLDGGQEAVIKGFVRPATVSSDTHRFPLSDADSLSVSLDKLHEYLNELAKDDEPIVNIDSNRFEVDETRHIFSSQKAAVQAFSRALAGVELRLRHGQPDWRVDLSGSSQERRIMDKGAGARFWGVKVGRSLLMKGAESVTFDKVLTAFGGVRVRVRPTESLSSQGEIDPDADERVVEAIDLVSTEQSQTDATSTSHAGGTVTDDHEVQEQDENEDEESSDDAGSDSDDEPNQTIFRRRFGFGRSRERANVNVSVPYSSHSRVYKGHCNTRTVKDVNYYGMDDEYVVSGSDDGHFFIWDRKTSRVVNILKGDGEVVNVVQGHPYEPMIACSGIDSTIKIFGPGGDSRERHHASKGVNVANPGGSVHSSLRFGGRRRRARMDDDDSDQDQGQSRADEEGTDEEDEEASVPARGLRSRQAMQDCYRIMQGNDEERRNNGQSETYISDDALLAHLAAAMQRGQLRAIGGEGQHIVVNNEDCSVM